MYRARERFVHEIGARANIPGTPGTPGTLLQNTGYFANRVLFGWDFVPGVKIHPGTPGTNAS